MDTEKIYKVLGIGESSRAMRRKINEYEDWFKGSVGNFHSYSIFNGKHSVPMNRASLNMAKTVAEAYADLLLNEKVVFTFDGENGELIQEVLDDNKFLVRGNELVESAFALGTGALVLSMDDLKVRKDGVVNSDEARIKIKYVRATDIFIIDYDSNGVESLAVRTIKNAMDENGKMKEYTLLSIIKHEYDNNWSLNNRLFDSKGKEITGGEFDWILKGTIKYLMFETEAKPFVIIKPNIVNNFESNSPYGVSVYGGAIDVLKEIDTVFDSLTNEFNLGKKRIFIDEKALSYDSAGNPKFDDRDVVFYTLGGLMGEGEGKVGESMKESDFKLRVEEHARGLKLGLDTLSKKVGLGGDYFDYDSKGAVTATEVVSKNSTLYRSISKHSILLREELEALVGSINAMLNSINNTKHEIGVTIDFDDSVIEDRKAIEQRALVELNNNIIDLHEYLKVTRGYTDKMAKDFIKEMEKREQKKKEKKVKEVNEDGTEDDETKDMTEGII